MKSQTTLLPLASKSRLLVDEQRKAEFLRCAVEASRGNTQPWNAFWVAHHENITFQDLALAPETGLYKDIPVLMCLAMAAANESPAPWNNMWTRFGKQIALFDLIKAPSQSEYSHISTLWWLARAASIGEPDPWNRVYESLSLKFRNPLPPGILSQVPTAGRNKNMSLIWHLALATTRSPNEAKPWHSIWKRYVLGISHKNLLESPIREEFKSLSILLLLAYSKIKHGDTSFDQAWEKCAKNITLKELLAFPSQKPFKDLSVFRLLAFYLKDKGDARWLEQILAKIPGMIPESLLNHQDQGDFTHLSMKALLQQAGRKGKQILFRIETRNVFFKTLNPTLVLTEEICEELNALAKSVVDSGYQNAYWDLGVFFEENNQIERAEKAFAKTPKEAWRHNDAMNKVKTLKNKRVICSASTPNSSHQRSVEQRDSQPLIDQRVFKDIKTYINTEFSLGTDRLEAQACLNSVVQALGGKKALNVNVVFLFLKQLKEKQALRHKNVTLINEVALLKKTLDTAQVALRQTISVDTYTNGEHEITRTSSVTTKSKKRCSSSSLSLAPASPFMKTADGGSTNTPEVPAAKLNDTNAAQLLFSMRAASSMMSSLSTQHAACVATSSLLLSKKPTKKAGSKSNAPSSSCAETLEHKMNDTHAAQLLFSMRSTYCFDSTDPGNSRTINDGHNESVVCAKKRQKC